MIPFVAMTGGLACGKTTATEIFRGLGITVIDTDEVSRKLTGINGRANEHVRKAFGDSMINDDGSLNRERMRRLVFSSPSSLTKLEDILHPMVKEETLELIKGAKGEYAVLVVPLLFETGYYLEYSFTSLSIEAPEEAQIARIISKGWSREEAEGAIGRQFDSATRRAHADLVVENDSTIKELEGRIVELDARFREMFREK